MSFYAEVEKSEWSEDAVDLYAVLSQFALTDEGALVVLCAAAMIVAPHMGAATAAYEFGRIVQDAQAAISPPFRPVVPALTVVGGQDAH